jgi:hypothetical protein
MTLTDPLTAADLQAALDAPVGAPFIGIVMLQTRFARPLGDVGHPGSFDAPTRQLVVPGAVPRAVVTQAQSLRESGLAEGFCACVELLVARGAMAITTSCGFLVLLQEQLQAAADRAAGSPGVVSVVSSSLLQLPGLLRQQPQVGVLTMDEAALGADHLLAAGVPAARLADVIVYGLDPQCHLADTILNDREGLDLRQAQADALALAVALKAAHPHLTDVVLECTNLPPYQAAMQQATGMRCHSLLTDTRLQALA